MSDAVTVNIKGLDELQKTLEEMPRDVSRKILRNDLKDSGEYMRQEMSANAPYASGFLSEHFDSKVKIKSDELAGSAFVGPMGKMYYPGGDKEKGVATGKFAHKGGLVPVASVARFLEFGTSKMSPHPFMRNTFEQNKDGVMIKIIEGIKTAIEKWTK